MSNKKNNMGDEYQFPHDEYVAAEDDAQPNYTAFQGESSAAEESVAETALKQKLTDRFPFLQNKRVLAVIGAAVIALIGFKMMTPSHSVKVVKKAKPAISQQTIAQQEQQNILMNKLDRLSQDASSNQNAVNHLQGEVGGLKSALSESNRSNKDMREAIIALAQQVQNLSTEIKKATIKKHGKKLPPSPVLTYHLRAVVPGRAWVMGSNGESDTVTVGTQLKRYGTVKAINADAGIITTSSGKTITYNGDGN